MYLYISKVGDLSAWSIYLSIYIYIVLFGPVKPELGVIPSGQENHSGTEHINFPGRELNVLWNSRGISVHAFEFSKAENLSAQHMG